MSSNQLRGPLAGLILLVCGRALAYDAAQCSASTGAADRLANPILFVTQVPIPQDFATIGSVFANHLATMRSVGRGGDLFLLEPDGTLCNLTRAAGFGGPGEQDAEAIAVRNPDVHFDGDRAVFAMVVGGPSRQFEFNSYFWQLFEVSGLRPGEPLEITRVPNQPADANNVMPVYAPDGTIVFVSDRPHNGLPHLYPPLDEYESTETPSGLWRLDAETGALTLLGHSPSGSFDPLIDSFGRVVFTRWDHLQQDQQSDTPGGLATFGGHDFASEAADAERLETLTEVFPEPRPVPELVAGTNLNGHRFNHFFPWMVNLDGSEEETLNHVGRHELHSFFARSFTDDAALDDFIDAVSGRTNGNDVFNVLQLAEDPNDPGRFFAVDAPEFQTHASGQIFALTATPETNPDDITVTYVTHPDTETVTDDPSPEHSGHYREPLVLANGTLVAAHTEETGEAGNLGTRAAPDPAYDFQLKALVDAGNGFLEAGPSLTGGIDATVSYFDPDVLVTYSGPLWELNPIEIRVRPVPPVVNEPDLAAPERAVFDRVGVDEGAFRRWMAERNLALMVARNVTTRDDLDVQQPYNLRVPGGAESVGSGGRVYDVAHFQFFQGDMIRGYEIQEGRRVLSRVLHDEAVLAETPLSETGPAGSVDVFPDGSVASFVPTRRAMAWQLTAPEDHTPVVRERVWITFQPGEVRVCDGCHGVNRVSQAGVGPATNEAQALEALLTRWQQRANDGIFSSGFERSEAAL
ncbi:MAG: hypothetical protein AAGE01_14665 [Pseudomonadota bacterium]